MIVKVVLDTNIVVSANLVDEGPSAAILDLAIDKNILMVVSPAVLDEYEKALRRPRLKIDPLRIVDVLGLIRKNGLLVHPTVVATAPKGDESDNRFLECAGAGQADYIVTGNTKHFKKSYKTTKIITGRGLLELLTGNTAL